MNGIIEKSQRQIDKVALESINVYTRRPYTEKELYTFSVVLCDNEVDRDFECFTAAALKKLGELFVGKTGILDHEATSRNQMARIYAAKTRTVPEKRTSRGEVYTQLVADAYIPRGAETNGFIESVESGIRKEVSVGCAVAKRSCSICGAESCTHMRGRLYDGVPCVRLLEEPTDAYEFSFVAVPAQRAAGVEKQFLKNGEGKENMEKDVLKRLMETTDSVTVSGEDFAALKKALHSLQARAADADRYRDTLKAGIMRLSAAAQPHFGHELLEAILKGLSVQELEEMQAALQKAASDRLPVYPQLSPEKSRTQDKTPDDRAFYI